MDKIKKLLELKSEGDFKKGSLWKVIDDEVITYPVHPDDIGFDYSKANSCYKPSICLNNSHNDCGINFSDEQMVCKLFSSDSTSNLNNQTYYPAIWIGRGNLERIDEYSIYILDYEDFEEGYELKSVGNFRTYVEKVLTDFLDQYKKEVEDEYIKTAEMMLKELSTFSNTVIDKGNYKPMLC